MARVAKIEIYRDFTSVKEWRSRIRAANGQIVATSGEGYKRKHQAIAMAAKYFNAALPVEVLQ